MPTDPLLLAARAAPDAPVVAVTDARGLTEAWTGSAALQGLVAVDAGRQDRLAPTVTLLLATVDERAVDLVRRLRWDDVRRCRALLLRGLARHPLTLDVLDALAAHGLRPVSASRRTLGAFDGVEVQLERDRPGDLATLTVAASVATLGRTLSPVRNETPRVALAGVDAAWTAGLDNVHTVDPRWSLDPSLLREASPTVVLARHDALDGPLAEALVAARDLGARLVVEGAAGSQERPAADATLEGLPLPLPPEAFAAHHLYASGSPDAVRSGATDAPTDGPALLRAAAAGVPLAGLRPEDVAAAGIDGRLASLLTRPRAEVERSPASLDVHQVRLRRAATDLASTAAVWEAVGGRLGLVLVPMPRFLAVALPRTPEGAERLLADLARQRHPHVDLLLVGDPDALPSPPPGARVLPRASLDDLLTVARRVGADRVTLLEEHVRYGPEHLADLTRAGRTSDADLLLRPAELVAVDGAVGRVGVEAPEAATRDPRALATAACTEDLALLDPATDLREVTATSLAAALLDLGARAFRTHGLGLLALEPGDVDAPEVADDPDLHDDLPGGLPR